jgi:hypothetical protein
MGKFYKTPEANISVSTTATTLEVGAKASAQKVYLLIDYNQLAELEEVVVYVGYTTRLLVKCRIINSYYALVDYPTFH